MWSYNDTLTTLVTSSSYIIYQHYYHLIVFAFVAWNQTLSRFTRIFDTLDTSFTRLGRERKHVWRRIIRESNCPGYSMVHMSGDVTAKRQHKRKEMPDLFTQLAKIYILCDNFLEWNCFGGRSRMRSGCKSVFWKVRLECTLRGEEWDGFFLAIKGE